LNLPKKWSEINLNVERVVVWLVSIVAFFAAWLAVIGQAGGEQRPSWLVSLLLIFGGGLLFVSQVCVLLLVLLIEKRVVRASSEQDAAGATTVDPRPWWLKKLKFILPVAIVFAGVCVSAYAWITSSRIDLRITGSNTIGSELMPELVKAFLRDNRKAVEILVHSGVRKDELIVEGRVSSKEVIRIATWAPGTDQGISDLEARRSDIAMASRKITTEEAGNIGCSGKRLAEECETTIGLDGILVIVNKENRLTDLTTSQVHDFFSGAQPSFGPGKVQVYWRGPESGTTDFFISKIFRGDTKTDKKDYFARDAVAIPENQALSDAVSKNSLGIGFVGGAFAEPSKALSIDGIKPTEAAIRSKVYPLSRELYLYNRHDFENKLGIDLIEFALGDSGQRIVQRSDFLRLTLPTIPEEPPKLRGPSISVYTKSTEGWKQHEIVFHFDFNQALLTNLSRRDLGNLLDALKGMGPGPWTVRLLGFSDRVGSAESKFEKSVQRSRAVERELAVESAKDPGSGIVVCQPEGWSDSVLTPGGDPDSDRRVEVWYRRGGACPQQ